MRSHHSFYFSYRAIYYKLGDIGKLVWLLPRLVDCWSIARCGIFRLARDEEGGREGGEYSSMVCVCKGVQVPDLMIGGWDRLIDFVLSGCFSLA